jgi:hypothetical protein
MMYCPLHHLHRLHHPTHLKYLLTNFLLHYLGLVLLLVCFLLRQIQFLPILTRRRLNHLLIQNLHQNYVIRPRHHLR